MKPTATRIVYIVRLRAEPGMTDEQANRSLRAFLKLALRSYGLRCLDARLEATADGGEHKAVEP